MKQPANGSLSAPETLATLPTEYHYNNDTCNKDILDKGVTVIYMSGDATQQEMESWCSQIRTLSGQHVDWFTFGGGDVIRTVGDTTKVKSAILDSYPQLYNQVRARKPDADERFLLHYNMRV